MSRPMLPISKPYNGEGESESTIHKDKTYTSKSHLFN